MPQDNNQKQAGSPQGGNSKGNQQRNPRTTFYSCKAISAKKLLLLTFLFTLGAKLGLASIPMFDVLNNIGWLLMFAIVGILIFVGDLVLSWFNGCQAWLTDHPVKGWKVYPRQTSDWVIYGLFIVVLLLVLYIFVPNWWAKLATEWSMLGMLFNTSVSSSSSGDLPVVPAQPDTASTLCATNPDSEDCELTIIGDGNGQTIISKAELFQDCQATWWKDPTCATLPEFLTYWKSVMGLSDKSVAYDMNNLRKCWDCGDLTNGSGRNPPDCNPFIGTLRGTNPRTLKFQESESCLKPPVSMEFPL